MTPRPNIPSLPQLSPPVGAPAIMSEEAKLAMFDY
jgi:hypothetical protein